MQTSFNPDSFPHAGIEAAFPGRFDLQIAAENMMDSWYQGHMQNKTWIQFTKEQIFPKDLFALIFNNVLII